MILMFHFEPTGGRDGWPHENGTFVYRETNSEVAYAVLDNLYSIGYVGQDKALEYNLDTFSIRMVGFHLGAHSSVTCLEDPDDCTLQIAIQQT